MKEALHRHPDRFPRRSPPLPPSDLPVGSVDVVFDELRGFRQTIPAITSFQGGDYNSPWGLSQGFSYRFTMTFSDEPVHDAYLPQLAHQAVVAMLQPMLDGG